VLPAVARTRVEIANLLGIFRRHLNGILNEKKPISPSVAVRLGKHLGNGPDLSAFELVPYSNTPGTSGLRSSDEAVACQSVAIQSPNLRHA
jgi:hypothetical protein